MNSEIFDSVEDCIEEFASGGMVIVVDDEWRENEGDLIVAAEKITPEKMNVLVTLARGLVCVPTTSERLARLGIDDMVRLNRDAKGTAFTVTVDAARGITTGISAADRARTVRLMADPDAKADDFVSPGHVNPLRARPGGVLERAGHTEAAVDLARLAGLFPCAAICEIMNADGTMARLPDLVKFREKHGYKMMSVASLIEYRLRTDTLIKKIFERPLQTRHGEFKLVGFRSSDGLTHFALTLGDIGPEPTFARVHAQNILADLFADVSKPDAGRLFDSAMSEIAREGRGALVYVSLPDSGLKLPEGVESPAGVRNYGMGAQILRALGFKQIKLLTSHVGAHALSDGFGLKIVSEKELK